MIAMPPFTRLLLELYTHHDLPLGGVEVVVDDRIVARRVETCCPAPQCKGVPRGQGVYHAFAVPPHSAAPLPLKKHTITINVVPRGEDEPPLCAKEGHNVSIVGLIGLV